MSEMVERVALAISGSDDPANILEIHRTRARLAIEAMREPTRKMLYCGGDVYTSQGGEITLLDAESIWQAMIDEALK